MEPFPIEQTLAAANLTNQQRFQLASDHIALMTQWATMVANNTTLDTHCSTHNLDPYDTDTLVSLRTYTKWCPPEQLPTILAAVAGHQLIDEQLTRIANERTPHNKTELDNGLHHLANALIAAHNTNTPPTNIELAALWADLDTDYQHRKLRLRQLWNHLLTNHPDTITWLDSTNTLLPTAFPNTLSADRARRAFTQELLEHTLTAPTETRLHLLTKHGGTWDLATAVGTRTTTNPHNITTIATLSDHPTYDNTTNIDELRTATHWKTRPPEQTLADTLTTARVPIGVPVDVTWITPEHWTPEHLAALDHWQLIITDTTTDTLLTTYTTHFTVNRINNLAYKTASPVALTTLLDITNNANTPDRDGNLPTDICDRYTQIAHSNTTDEHTITTLTERLHDTPGNNLIPRLLTDQHPTTTALLTTTCGQHTTSWSTLFRLATTWEGSLRTLCETLTNLTTPPASPQKLP